MFLSPQLAGQVNEGGETAKQSEAKSQDEKDQEGKEELAELPEMIVTPSRAPSDPRLEARSISSIGAERMRERGARTTPEALRDVPGVHVQHTNTGGGSPFLRGLTGNQILILVDGVRLNNSTTRFGPNQALNTIDPALIDRIEVVRGPGSVLYGSDAIGGVVQIFTKKRPFLLEDREFGGGIYGRYSTAEDSGTATLDFGGSLEKWDFFTALSGKTYGELQGGADRGSQDFTDYDQWDFAGSAIYHIGEEERLRVAYQMTRQDDVDRTDALSVQRVPTYVPDAINRFQRQQRQLGYVTYEREGLEGLADDMSATLSVHRHLEKRKRQRQSGPAPFTPRDEIRYEEDDVYVFGASMVFHKQMGSAEEWLHDLTYGFDFYYDYVESSRHDYEPSTGTWTTEVGRFADDATYLSLGVFAHDRIQVAKGWTIAPGVRWSLFDIDATIEQSGGGASESLNNSFQNFTWSLSSNVDLCESVTLIGSVATAFRAPNMDDSTISGGFAFGEEIPNPDLDPENALDLELGVRVREGGFRGEVFAFHTTIDDIIQRVETAPGSGEFQRQNVGHAYVGGVEANGEYDFGEGWTAFASFAWTVGRLFSDVDPSQDDVPFRRIPPAQGNAGLRFVEPQEERLVVEGMVRWARAQERLHPDDIRDNRIGPEGTPGYGVVDLHGSYKINENVRTYLSLENIGDVDYRVHGSGYLAPGRNLILGMEVRF